MTELERIYIDVEELREKLDLPGHPVAVEMSGRNVGFAVPKPERRGRCIECDEEHALGDLDVREAYLYCEACAPNGGVSEQ